MKQKIKNIFNTLFQYQNNLSSDIYDCKSSSFILIKKYII